MHCTNLRFTYLLTYSLKVIYALYGVRSRNNNCSKPAVLNFPDFLSMADWTACHVRGSIQTYRHNTEITQQQHRTKEMLQIITYILSGTYWSRNVKSCKVTTDNTMYSNVASRLLQYLPVHITNVFAITRNIYKHITIYTLHTLPQQIAQLNCTHHNYRTIQNTISMIYKQASIMPNSYNISEIQRERFHWCFASWYNNDNNNILDYLIVVHSKSLAKHVINKQTDITNRWTGVWANFSKGVRHFCPKHILTVPEKKTAYLTRPNRYYEWTLNCLFYIVDLHWKLLCPTHPTHQLV